MQMYPRRQAAFLRFPRWTAAALSLVTLQLAPAPDAAAEDLSSQMQEALQKQGMQIDISSVESNMRRLQDMQKSVGQPKWESIASAPADFPAPIFRGTNTRFLSNEQSYIKALVPGQMPSAYRSLSIDTQDHAGVVITWYDKAMTAAGWKMEKSTGPLPQYQKSGALVSRQFQWTKDQHVCRLSVTGTTSAGKIAPHSSIGISVMPGRGAVPR